MKKKTAEKVVEISKTLSDLRKIEEVLKKGKPSHLYIRFVGTFIHDYDIPAVLREDLKSIVKKKIETLEKEIEEL